MASIFNFSGEYAPEQGLAFRVALSYPGDWSAAAFLGGIEASSGAPLGSWSFEAPSYDDGTDTTQINCTLARSITAALPLAPGNCNYDILARLPDQEPVRILRGRMSATDVISDPSALIGSGSTDGSFAPQVRLTVQVNGQVTVEGVAGFSTAIVDAAIATYIAQNPVSGDAGIAFETTFTSTNLTVAGLLPVVHDLNRRPSGVVVWNPVGESVAPDGVDVISLNAIAINLESFVPISGTWRVSLVA
ncbi:hypothetical protein [Leptolyngbya sp. FACHB-16]|uniref:hypothetical protein n=1 Tax=unclassified Leptolyngbya TaxID=2650499 RepID=UPI001682D11A|nr:hypothetical protein [Leptolyngbya sp. FACHB-16]MBD2156232.1 hypothetical protein [Leptolyngbya sp. FACHB-16]